jgi:dihydroxyacid dehydratase/phosphogluconate dehydratase
VPAVLKELAPLLHADALTVTGGPLADGFTDAHALGLRRHRPARRAARLWRRDRGRARHARPGRCGRQAERRLTAPAPPPRPRVVFENVHDFAAWIDDPALDVTADSVLVLRNSGPKGGPGMPEWGQLPIPRRLLADV